MLEDFLMDPVLAARWIFQRDLDVFQRVRLKMMWWVPFTMDSSGISTGKTIVDFIYANLRAMLLPALGEGQEVGVYFFTFAMGKDTFWRYYSTINAPIFAAQLGEVDNPDSTDKTAKRRDPSCWSASFKSGGAVFLPAPDVMGESKNQSSRRFNTLIVEEWTKFDASGNAINAELIGRNTKACFNQSHPLWANHVKYMAHAEVQSHPAYKRYEDFQREIRKGNPFYAHITFSYKDFSDLLNHEARSFKKAYRADAIMALEKAQCTPDEVLSKLFGLWVKSGMGWYTEDALEAAVELGRQLGILPMINRRQPMLKEVRPDAAPV